MGLNSEKQRIDQFLAMQMPDYISRTQVKSLIESGNVFLNDKLQILPKKRLKKTDKITIHMPAPIDAKPEPEAIDLEVLFEDKHVIVINKPAGMVVHPGAGNRNGTLVNALLYHCGAALSGIGGIRRPGIVHRLDKDTSGVMVAAKTAQAHASLSRQFADHGRSGALKRAYMALIWGAPQMKTGTINVPLIRADNPLKKTVTNDGNPRGRHAVTHYKVIKTFTDKNDKHSIVSLVECILETGRTHQIRVHMEYIGHPLLGDQLYGKHFATKSEKLKQPACNLANALKRQALHAALLGFNHPETNISMKFKADLPNDLKNLIATL